MVHGERYRVRGFGLYIGLRVRFRVRFRARVRVRPRVRVSEPFGVNHFFVNICIQGNHVWTDLQQWRI